MTREIDKYLVEARQLRSVEHLVCTNLPLPPALLCGCRSTPGSLRFLIFCQVSYWVWCPSSPILPVFACFLSLPLTVSNKNFFQKHWCSHFIWLTCLFYFVGGEGGKVLLGYKNTLIQYLSENCTPAAFVRAAFLFTGDWGRKKVRFALAVRRGGQGTHSFAHLVFSRFLAYLASLPLCPVISFSMHIVIWKMPS